MTPASSILSRSLWMRWLIIGTKSIRPSPRVERYLALICGGIIIGVTCRVWYALQVLSTDGGIWSGSSDPYLLQFRPTTAWLWQHDPYGVVLLVWALVGLVALGPFTSAAWRSRTWPTVAWGIVTLAGCFAYVVVAFNLMMLPLGRFG